MSFNFFYSYVRLSSGEINRKFFLKKVKVHREFKQEQIFFLGEFRSNCFTRGLNLNSRTYLKTKEKEKEYAHK